MIPYGILRPVLGALPPETAHDLTIRVLAAGLGPKAQISESQALAIRVWGLEFSNPLGLAAGFDKDARVMGPMLDLGFGFVEIGTLTPRPQDGNPKPRMFRLAEHGAVINRMGFNNAGIVSAARRLEAFRRRHPDAIIGVNVGKNRDSADAAADYAAGAALLAPSASYLTINVSSPNTPGLRMLQSRDALERICRDVRTAMGPARRPLLVKIAPDLADADRADIAALALDGLCDGLIVSNTTIARPPDLTGPAISEPGGLSGRPLFQLSTEGLSDMYARTEGRVRLVGVGGISGPDQAYAKIRAGASLIQLYTALAYEGPDLIGRILAGLAARLADDGFRSIEQAVGADHR